MAGVVVCMINYANKPLCMFGESVTEVRGKCGSCSWSQTHQTPSRTIICCSSSESQKYPYRTKPRWLVWLFACSTMQTNLCVCSGTVSRRCVASVGAAVGRKRIKHHRGLSFVAAVVNFRNIPTEPNHDGWCGCLHAQLCKQTFVYVRGRCHGGAWQVWELQLVANASNTIADYHLLHLW